MLLRRAACTTLASFSRSPFASWTSPTSPNQAWRNVVALFFRRASRAPGGKGAKAPLTKLMMRRNRVAMVFAAKMDGLRTTSLLRWRSAPIIQRFREGVLPFGLDAWTWAQKLLLDARVATVQRWKLSSWQQRISHLNRASRRTRAQELLQQIENAAPEKLNAIAMQIGLRDLLVRFDRKLFGPRWRRKLLDIARRRIGDLSLESKIALASNLNIRSKRDQQLLADFILNTNGKELTELKRGIDTNGLFDVVDIGHHFPRDLLDKVLKHIEDQAHRLGKLPKGIKILCDIDDTIFCAFKDRGFPRGVIYPGVTSALEALRSGPSCGPNHQSPASLPAGDLVFLTARPTGIRNSLERLTYRYLRRYGFTDATVLSGTLLRVFSHEQMCFRKMENFRMFQAFYPEYHFVFIGDSGQGDIALARLLLKHVGKSGSENSLVSLVLIHDITTRLNVPLTSPQRRKDLRKENIIVFDSYLEAGLFAFDAGLISTASLRHLVNATKSELSSIIFPNKMQEQKRSRWIEFQRAEVLTLRHLGSHKVAM